MKKLFAFLILTIFFLSGCSLIQNTEVKKYNINCKQGRQEYCAKFLFIQTWNAIKNESYTTNIDKQDWSYWKNRYIDKIKTQEDAYVAVESMIESLDDPFTRFLTPEELEEQNMSISSELSGIGVVISSLFGKVKIEDIIENSPAQKNGLKINDIIMYVDDNSVSGLDIKKIASMIRGKSGTSVKIVLMRDKKIITKNITRANIKLKSVSYKKLKNDIGYIRISTFMSQSASKEFLEALEKSKNDKKLILDLRGNQGGLLQNGIFISNILLKEGTIVSVVGRNANEKTKVQSSGIHDARPLVVLTNGLTASASEILAAALKDNGRAVLVGEKTFGKGLIQKIVYLPLNTAANVTIAKYLTPNGIDIHKNGIKPDYEVKFTEKDGRLNKDPQLDKAIELLER